MTLQSESSYARRRWRALLAAATLAVLAAAPAPALGETSGGIGDGDPSSSPPSQTAPGANAELLPNGDAAPPAGAPPQVVRAIQFANRINEKPYRWGGGHSSWKIDKGYDCSGAVSYALHGAGRKVLKAPMPSGSFAKWGEPGEGEWITVYTNAGHMYSVIAGLRWDTSGGAGPRWHEDERSSKGFQARHYPGL